MQNCWEKNLAFDFLNYVAHSRGFSYLCDVHTNTRGTHPETYHALAIGSDSFFAAHCLANVLRVFACEELPLRSSPTSSVDRRRFHATNWCHGLHTPPRPLLIACIHNKREVHQLFSQQLPEIQLAKSIRLRKKWVDECIHLNHSKDKGEYPYLPIFGVDTLLQLYWRVSGIVVVINLMPELEMV